MTSELTPIHDRELQPQRPQGSQLPDARVYALVHSGDGTVLTLHDGTPINGPRHPLKSGEQDALRTLDSYQLRSVHLDYMLRPSVEEKRLLRGPAYLYWTEANKELHSDLSTYPLVDLIEQNAGIISTDPHPEVTLNARRNLKLYQHVLKLCMGGKTYPSAADRLP